MNTVFSQAPYANMLGIQDLSPVPPVASPEQLPSFLPHIYIFAQSGPTLPQLVDSNSSVLLYGADSFDPTKPYANHQTALLNTVSAAGGAAMVQRVLPSDAAPPAAFGLYLDIVAEPALPQYKRNADGSYQLDVNGNPIQVTGAGATAAGVVAKWVIKTLAANAIGAGVVTAGSFQNSAAVQSQLYPIAEFQASFVGSHGNNLGVNLWAPTALTNPPANTTTIDATGSYVYRLSFAARANALATPNTIQSIAGEQSVEFSFEPGIIDPVTEKLLSYDSNVIPSYESIVPGMPATYGPFQQMYVYQANLATVRNMIYAVEQPAGLLGSVGQYASSIVNLFGATDPNGVPYYNFKLQGPAQNGLLLGQNVTQYALGGSDGTMSFTTFDTAVQNQLQNYGSLEASLLDAAMYPQSVLIDSGFTIATKKAFATPMSLRKDIAVVLSTQDVSQPQNDASAESSIAVALRTYFNNFPESTVYGTPVCRAMIIAQSGQLINSAFQGYYPLTLQFAQKAVAYMGAGNGIWKSGFGYDSWPNNQITMFKNVNNAYKPALARNADWQTGLVWAQNADRKSLFWPQTQTVYTDASSVLNSSITMFACVELEKVCQRVWTQLTGAQGLTNNQFITKSNNLINANVVNRFDNRFVISASTYFTQQDIANGNTWSCKITIAAPTQKTVGTFTITAVRSDSVQSSSAKTGA